MEAIAELLLILIQAVVVLLFVYVLLSYVMSPMHPLRQALSQIVDPILRPIRELMPQTGGFDFSVLVLFVILYLLRSLIEQLIR